MKELTNYQRQCEIWREKFLTMDVGELCRRLPELECRDSVLLLWHFGRKLAVDRRDGTICCVSDRRPVWVMTKFNVYTLFWYCKPQAVQTGEYVPFKSLPGGSPFERAFQTAVLDVIAATFSGKEALLEEAVKKLRGKRLSASGFSLEGFGCMPVRLYFWDADEDFPAQANLLFDRSATDFIHVESVVTVATELLYELAEAAQVPVLGHPFVRF